jgi:hypothetical protein
MTAYVVACWFGERRVIDNVYINNRSDYIEWQLKKLEELNHSIEAIYFVLNDLTYNINLPSQINSTPIYVDCRENIGMSYGAWNHALMKYGTDHEYMMLIEDDYIPVIDQFDQIYKKYLKEKTAYVCSLYANNHAAISNGLIKTKALIECGGIPFADNASYGANETAGQVGISRSIQSHGYEVEHIANDYSVPFLDANGGIIHYGRAGGEVVLSPIMLERKLYERNSAI